MRSSRRARWAASWSSAGSPQHPDRWVEVAGEPLVEAPASGGRVDQHPPAVAQVGAAVDQVQRHHPVDHLGQGGRRQHGELGDLLHPTALIAPLPPEPGAAVQTALRELATGTGGLTIVNLGHGLFRGVGEVRFEDNLLTGVIFLIAILVNSRLSALFAVLGSAVALLTALALGADGFTIYHGLYGFNAVLLAPSEHTRKSCRMRPRSVSPPDCQAP
jgi:hypothetical protein